MPMATIGVLLCMLALPAWAQVVFAGGSHLPGIARYFDRTAGETPLACEVMPIRPALNFGFRFQAGYVMRVPLSQLAGAGHRLNVLVEITPRAGNRQPVYLGTRFALPQIPATRMSASIGGGYLLGEGRYRVRWLLFDKRRRVCRKEWDMEARRGRAERKIVPSMPPNTVAGLWLRTPSEIQQRHTDDAAPFRLTLLLDATPVSPRRTRLGPRDRMLLAGWVGALLERLPARSVRLIGFSLDQQKEIFRKDDCVPKVSKRLMQALNGLELDVVDYHVLQIPAAMWTCWPAWRTANGTALRRRTWCCLWARSPAIGTKCRRVSWRGPPPARFISSISSSGPFARWNPRCRTAFSRW